MNTRSSIYEPFAQVRLDREARFGLRIASWLAASANLTSADVDTRLRFAREQALSRARQSRLATAPAAVHTGPGTLAMTGTPRWWQRALALVPLLLLVAGLGLVQHWSQREQMLAAADVDAVLLADDLPPGAYSDPGFAEYLRSAPP